jgi:POT family proton-dependent oligopeptide transporter
VLFGAEMFERLSFYGMRALLVLYLVNHLGRDRADALDLYATYTGLVYLTPVLGGYLADKYLGQRKAVLTGGILMALGHLAMAFEPLLYLAMGLLVLGNGFFKPNISTMVGQLYPGAEDGRRDAAYTLFYQGINLGAFLAPCICGTLGERVGWHLGFGAAGVGMVLGLLNFALFQRSLGGIGLAPGHEGTTATRLTAADWSHVVMLSLVGIAVVVAALAPVPAVARSLQGLAKPVLLTYWALMSLAMIAATRYIARPATFPGARAAVRVPDAPFTREQWGRMAVILIVAISSIMFWMGFEQAGGTLNLFADQKTDRVFFGREFPASLYQAVNPLLIIALAPLFSVLWTRLDRTRFRINSAAKMGIGLVLLGLGMVVMQAIDRESTATSKTGPHWLVIVYLFCSLGELCLSPIGLSLVNRLAPRRVASLMMALWFTCTAAASYLAGKTESIVGQENLWGFLIAASIVPGLILLAVSSLLKRMAHGRL